jgi:hypothetical protein
MSQTETTPSGDVVANELARLRDRLKIVDEIDRSTTEMVVRLAEAVRSSAEVRAQANLEISASIDHLERSVKERDSKRRDVMLALQQEVALAHARAGGVGVALTGLESELSGLQARLTESEAGIDNSPDEAPAAPKLQPLPSAESIFIEIDRVPTAGAALSLQRFVAELPGVVAATTREYAAGLLRLEVRTRGPFDPANLLAWPGGVLEVETRESDALVFQLVD